MKQINMDKFCNTDAILVARQRMKKKTVITCIKNKPQVSVSEEQKKEIT